MNWKFYKFESDIIILSIDVSTIDVKVCNV